MNILVTGSNGFIGSHVARYLKNKGHYVVGLGRKEYPACSTNVSQYICCDLAKDSPESILQGFFRGGGDLDVVIHLAADMRKEPYGVDVIEANCCGTQRLLEMCEQEQIGVFLQLSSLPVIGHPLEHPITESHAIHPYTIYHITKHTEELLAKYAEEYHGIRTASFRISAPVGTGVNPKTIFPTLIRRALANEDIQLLGKGTRMQNYVYVNDIASCLELAMINSKVSGVYNLTSDMLISNFDLANLVIRTLNSKSKITFCGEDPADEYVWDASIERIKQDAGYKPIANMKEIIIEYAKWIKDNE